MLGHQCREMDVSTRIRVYRAAALRKLWRYLGLPLDPYPPRPEGTRLSPLHGLLAENEGRRRCLAFDSNAISAWQNKARDRLVGITGYRKPLNIPKVIAEGRPIPLKDEADFVRTTYYLRAREDTDIPVTLISKRGEIGAAPVFMHLAGSTSGVHLGWGDARDPIDHQRLSIGADMALQAARRGYLAVCIEQIGYGERMERDLPNPSSDRTIDTAVHAALLGRSLIGLKAMDVSATVNWLIANSPRRIDRDRIYLFGHSSGGTAAQYTAALDPRIAGVLASGSVRRVAEIFETRGNGNGEYLLPGFLDAFETDDIVALVAPRPFVGLSGRHDHIFPFDGVLRVVDGARGAYRSMNADTKIDAVAAPYGHRYYADESWEAWRRVVDPLCGDDPKRR